MENTAKKYDLTEGNPWKIMLFFAFPIFLGTLFQSVYTMVDAIIIGQFAGKGALASIESVYTLTKLPVNFFTGLASGATIIISQYYGGKHDKQVSDASHNAIVFAFLGGLGLSILGCIFSPFFVRLIQVPEEILVDAQWYVIIYFSGMSVSMVYNVGAGILRAVGNSKTPFYILIVANLVNIILDLIFVIVFHFGVIGVAFATIVSQLLSAVLVVGILTRVDLACKIYIKKLRLYHKHVKEILKLGLPIGIQSTLYPVSNTIVQTSINTFGVDSIAAWAVCGKIDFLIWSISDAFCVSVSTFVAQNFGAKKIDRAKSGVWAGLVMAVISIMMVSTILYFFGSMFARLLVKDENVIRITTQIVRFLAPLYVIYVFCDILPGAIRGTGDTFIPMVITLFGTCVSRVVWVIFVVPIYPSLITVLACYPVSWGITAVAFIVVYFFTFSKIRVVETKKIDF